MAIVPEYIRKIFSIRCRLKTGVMTKSKDKNKAKAKSQAKILSDYRAWSKI